MNTRIKILIFINIFFALQVNASENILEENIANLWINELDHNTDITLLTDGQLYYIECNLLTERQIDITQLKKLSARPNYCLVSNGEIQSVFDQSSQAIKLTIPTHFFQIYMQKRKCVRPKGTYI